MSDSSAELLAGALRSLDAAIVAARPGERYAAAHLAALRAAAAMLATSAKPAARRPTSVWVLLAKVAPDLAEWAAFFASCSSKRIAAQAGVTSAVTEREADDLVREANQFISLVATRLGVPYQLVITA